MLRQLGMHRIIHTVILLLCLGLSPTVGAAWLFDASTELHFNDNIFNGEDDFDIKSDTSLSADASAGRYWQLTDNAGLVLVGTAGLEHYRRFTKLSNARLGVSSSLNYKFGLGLQAPVLNLNGSLNYRDSRDFTRDAWQGTVGLGVSKHITDRLEMRLSYQYAVDSSDDVVDIPVVVSLLNVHGDVYDLTSQQLALKFNYTLTNRLLIFGGYTRRHGDVVASTRLNFKIFEVSDAIAFDQAAGPNIVAYRLNARSNIYSLGLSWALTDHASLNANYQRWHTRTSGGFIYDNNNVFINLIYAY
jgi:opacity protein-like surface antigen